MLLSLHATLSDPGSPSESHHNDSPVLASGTLTPSPTASVAANGAESLRGGTSPLRPAMFSVYASPVLFAPDHPGLRNRRNTRYGLLVKLYPMGTYTPKEAPSCAWRTNVRHHLAQKPQAFGNNVHALVSCWLLIFNQFCKKSSQLADLTPLINLNLEP